MMLIRSRKILIFYIGFLVCLVLTMFLSISIYQNSYDGNSDIFPSCYNFFSTKYNNNDDLESLITQRFIENSLFGGGPFINGNSNQNIINTESSESESESRLLDSWPSEKDLTFLKKKHKKKNNGKIPSFGVLYVLGTRSPEIPAYSERYRRMGGRTNLYLRELSKSVDSLQSSNPDLSIALVIDDSSVIAKLNDGEKKLYEALDYIVLQKFEPKSTWGDKEIAMLISPYEQTIFLDLDTKVCMNISSMASFLRFYDIGLVMEPNGKYPFIDSIQGKYDLVERHETLFESNSGMVLYRKSQAVLNFLLAVYENHVNGSDQHYFHLTKTNKAVIYRLEDLRIIQLPIEYNLRYHMGKEPIWLRGKVRIVHSRYISCELVNEFDGPRILDPILNRISHHYEARENNTWSLIPSPFLEISSNETITTE